MIEQPTALRIAAIKDEAKDIRTFFFDYQIEAEPGQFIMLWIPRVNQKPFGVSYLEKGKFGITVCKVGSFTDKLFEKKVGDIVGIQGPYGKPFDTRGKNIALVAGGYGTAPLAFLAEKLTKMGKKVHLIIGARSKDILTFQDRFPEATFCTDDGSCGLKGFTTEALTSLIERERIDMVYSCGPEVMMKRVLDICEEHHIDCQLSLERYMKCGFGVCGQCCVDPIGICVCKDGPVFDKEVMKRISEFGRYHRDGTGRRLS
jgi:dihydroorotate dehydrogenase electron transfer subunit